MIGVGPDLAVRLAGLLCDPTSRTGGQGLQLRPTVDERLHTLQVDPLILGADDQASVGLPAQAGYGRVDLAPARGCGPRRGRTPVVPPSRSPQCSINVCSSSSSPKSARIDTPLQLCRRPTAAVRAVFLRLSPIREGPTEKTAAPTRPRTRAQTPTPSIGSWDLVGVRGDDLTQRGSGLYLLPRIRVEREVLQAG